MKALTIYLFLIVNQSTSYNMLKLILALLILVTVYN